MQGKRVERDWGWDCHGLPIEHQIEKLHGKNIPADKVRELCRAYAAEQV